MAKLQGDAVAPAKITRLLRAWGEGDRDAVDQLVPLVYQELRRQAARQLRRERRDHTLQPTALVHEAFLRLNDNQISWKNRAQFFGVAARVMRRVLVDYARRRGAAKRAGPYYRVTLDEDTAVLEARDFDILALEECLEDLSKVDAVAARLVELRFFCGLSIEDTAQALGVSAATVNRDWRVARGWLYERLKDRTAVSAG